MTSGRRAMSAQQFGAPRPGALCLPLLCRPLWCGLLLCCPLLCGGCAGATLQSSAGDAERGVSGLDQSLAAYQSQASGARAKGAGAQGSSYSLLESRGNGIAAETAGARGFRAFKVTRIVSPEPPAAVPPQGTRRKIDLKLHRADLAESLRFLSHVGGMNLVLGEGVGGEVSVQLSKVTPFAALMAIAAAHGARVTLLSASQAGGAPILLVERRP